MSFPPLNDPDVRKGLHALIRAIVALIVLFVAVYIILGTDDDTSKKWATGIVGIIIGYYLK